jgi:O-methyltransferase
MRAFRTPRHGILPGRRNRLQPEEAFPPDYSREEIELWRAVRPYTMTSSERVVALRGALVHLVSTGVPGAIVECGVWRGGSSMAAALTLLSLDEVRPLYLFDTFEGMSPPTETDVSHDGHRASDLLRESGPDSTYWAIASIDEVRANLESTGYPGGSTHLISGRVEDTIPGQAPHEIALLRLDTDWYESTRHELLHLWPRLSPGGVLIVDDYGHWFGARRAADEFFASLEHPPFLHRIDYTARLAVKPT